jgi:release factor glutamine methyltransferase
MKKDSWHIGDLLKVTAAYLKKKGIASARLTAEVLLAHLLETDRVSLYLQFQKPLTDREVAGYRTLVSRRVRREPLQYITGVQEFWSMDFQVDPRVLVPRPETELLVEQGVGRAEESGSKECGARRLLDLGTGSGVLAVSLAKELPEWEAWAVDVSPGALEVARLNAEKHGLDARIRFRQGDLFEPFSKEPILFHLIVSNPPYVAEETYESLPPEVQGYEPRLALAAGKGGMDVIPRILHDAPAFLVPGGWLLMETSPDQTEQAMKIAEDTRCYDALRRVRDYSGRYRVVCARRLSEGACTEKQATARLLENDQMQTIRNPED